MSWRDWGNLVRVRDFPELAIYFGNNGVCGRIVIGAEMFRF